MSDTKNCPYCGEEVLIAAKKCKHCGEWLNKISIDAGKKIKEEIKMSKLSKLVVAGAVIGGVIGGVVGSNGGAGSTQSPMSEQQIHAQIGNIARASANGRIDPQEAQRQIATLEATLNRQQNNSGGGRTAIGVVIGAGLGAATGFGAGKILKGQNNTAEQTTDGSNPAVESDTYDARENF